MKNLLLAAAAVFALSCAAPALADVTGKDASGTSQTFCTRVNGSQNTPCSAPSDSGGGDATNSTDHTIRVENPVTYAAPTSTITRPADTTAYAAGDLVANSTTAGSVTPFSWSVALNASGCARIEKLVITKTGTAVTPNFKMFFFNASPTSTVGDNVAFDSSGTLSTSGAANLRGAIVVTMSTAASDGAQGAGTPVVGGGITVCPTSGTTIYGLMETLTAWTPTSAEQITASVEVSR
jgi:hypothetical protein